MGIHLITPLYVMVMQPPVKYSLMIDSTVGGDVTTPGEGLFPDYNAGAVVNLVATPDDGYGFVNWTGDVDTIANVNAASTTITMNGDYSITANFESLYGPPVTAYFYPDKHPEATCVDGYASNDNVPSPYSWVLLHDGPGTSAKDDSLLSWIMILSGRDTNRWYQLARSLLLFDTSSIPLGSSILSAELRILLWSKLQVTQWPLFGVVVIASNPLSNTQIVKEDYLRTSPAFLSNVILISVPSVGGYYTLTLNPAGKNQITRAGITKLGLREANYDCLNTAPPWVYLSQAYLQWRSGDETDLTFKPRLEVVYQPPA